VVILIHVKITKNKDRINYLIQPAQSPSTSSTLFNTRINPPLAPPRRGALSRNFFNPLQPSSTLFNTYFIIISNFADHLT
jgi:hypothetical protein